MTLARFSRSPPCARCPQQDAPFSGPALHKFVQAYLDGRLTPYGDSDPEPTEQTGAVVRIVGTTYKREVLEAGVDVALMKEFEESQCPHCTYVHPHRACAVPCSACSRCDSPDSSLARLRHRDVVQMWEQIATLLRKAGSSVKLVVVSKRNELHGTTFVPPATAERPEVYVIPASDPSTSTRFMDVRNVTMCSLLEFIADNSAPGAASLDAIPEYPAKLHCGLDGTGFDLAQRRSFKQLAALRANVEEDATAAAAPATQPSTAAPTPATRPSTGVPQSKGGRGARDVPKPVVRGAPQVPTKKRPAPAPVVDNEMAALAALAAGTDNSVSDAPTGVAPLSQAPVEASPESTTAGEASDSSAAEAKRIRSERRRRRRRRAKQKA